MNTPETAQRLEQRVLLQRDDIARIGEQYGLGTLNGWEVCGAGLVNSNYRLLTERGSYLLRVHPRGRTQSYLRFEISLLDHLHDRGFPAALPMRTTGGAPFTIHAGHLCSVLTWLPGRTVSQRELTGELAWQVGFLYARFRRVVEGFRPLGSRPNADQQAIAGQLVDLLPRIRHAAPRLSAIVDTSWREVERILPHDDADRHEVVHGDLFYENVLVDDAGRLTSFIDYDDAYLGLPSLDLAQVVMEFATPPDDQLDLGLATAVLEGFAASGGGLPDEQQLLAGLLFSCCKFLCYTAPLTRRQGEPLSENPYARRIVDLSDPRRRSALLRALRRAVGTRPLSIPLPAGRDRRSPDHWLEG